MGAGWPSQVDLRVRSRGVVDIAEFFNIIRAMPMVLRLMEDVGRPSIWGVIGLEMSPRLTIGNARLFLEILDRILLVSSVSGR
jgi:hypothetical protein